MDRKIELLAPAGDIDIAKAAINAGADAVYIGGRWSARAYAKNLDLNEIEELVRYAHLRGSKVYVALNTMLYNSELEDALSYTDELERRRVDAIIASDLGYITEVGKRFMIPVHASTQLSVCSREGAAFLKGLGVTRIVPARECSFAEIDEIAKEGLEIELFCHGALCSSVSGACLISGMISDRSGNRGTCAQICRQMFLKDGKEAHYLNTKDLCTVGLIDTFIRKGISSLKIEGRMKNVNYVVNTVRSYREMIDSASPDTGRIMDELRITFNRGGFTEGYFRGGSDVDYIEDNSHKGLSAGTVTRTERGRIGIRTSYPLSEGDSIEIGGRGFRIEHAESRDGLTFVDTKEKAVRGDKVFLKRSEALSEKEKDASSDRARRNVRFSFRAEEGGKAVLKASSGEAEATVFCDVPETSRKEVSEDSIRTSLEKTGGTVYRAEGTSVEIKGRPFIGTSMVNGLRRDVLSELDDRILDSFRYVPKELSQRDPVEHVHSSRYIAVETDQGSSLDSFDPELVDRIYFIPRNAEDIERLKVKRQIPVYLVVPPFISRDSGEMIRNMLRQDEYDISGIVAGNINSMALAQEKGVPFVTDYWQNISNEVSVRTLSGSGAQNITYSPECSISNIRSRDNSALEMLVYGKMDLMNICHGISGITTDEMTGGMAEIESNGNVFGLKNTYLGRNYTRLSNGRTLYITDTARIRETGISGIRLIYDGEDDFEEILRYYHDTFILGRKTETPEREGITRGHFIKGVD